MVGLGIKLVLMKKQILEHISKLKPGTKTIAHIHSGHEEFLILEGN